MATYEEIEEKLIRELNSWGFIQESKNSYSKTIKGQKLTFVIPLDNGDLFMLLNSGGKKEKYAICYISLHANGKKYLKEVLQNMLKKTDEDSTGETTFSFFSNNEDI